MRTFNLMYGGSGSPLSTPTVLKAGSTFVLGGSVTGFEHSVQVETEVNIDAGDATYPSSGQLMLTGNASRVRITYYADYLNYELDSDNDGSFETSSIINATSY